MSSLAFRLLAAQQAAASNTNLYMWGNNTYGQLGVGTVNTYYRWSQIHSGSTHTLALRNDGILFAWGNNSNGQLGDGTTISKNSPIQVGYFSWNQIAAGYAHSAGIRDDGTLWAWGGNQYYQLNDNTTIDKSYPVLISNESWSTVSAGAVHTIAVKQDGTLWAWGSDDSGQIGIKNSFVQIAVGLSHYAGIRADGTLWTWGTNASGELGNGTTVAQLVLTSPVVQILGSWVQVTAGNANTYGIKSNGTLWGWGDGAAGQLGDNTVVSKSTPVSIAPASSNIVQVVAGYDPNANGTYVMYRNNIGQVWATGYNGFLQLADGAGVNRSSPVQVAAVARQDAVSVGTTHAIVITTDGSLWAWGLNTFGQFGDNTTITRSSPVQVNTNKWISIRAGLGVTHAIKSDYTLWGWGANGTGVLGQNDTIDRSSPVQIGGSWLAISAGNGYALGIKADGSLWSWGNNLNGKLGSGDTLDRSSPVQVGTNSWIAVESSNGASAAIRKDWLLFTWGFGAGGQLGDGTTVSKSSPVQIGASSWAQVSVSTSGSYIAALTSDWKLFTWGNNVGGQLGDSTTNSRSSPVQVGTSSWFVISAGTSHTVGIDYSNRLMTWGNNISGQLGDTTTNSRSSPVQVGTSLWSTVAAKVRNTYGVRNDGTLWSWGANSATYGFLGDNTTVDKSSPVQVLVGSVIRGASSIFAGGRMTGLIDYGNKAYLWGYNSGGQLGDGTTTNRGYPSAMQIDKQWRTIAPTAFGGIGITTDNLLWGWGLNTFGEIGNDLPANPRSSPVQIGTSSWTMVAMSVSSPSTALGVDANNNLYGWGYNGSNLLGFGEATTISRSSPTLIGNYGTTQILGLNVGQLSLIQANGNFYALGGALAASQLGRSQPIQVPGFNPTYQRLIKVGNSSYSSVSAGKYHNVAITSDNKLFAWGNNIAGQLGDGTLSTRSSPVQIGLSNWNKAIAGGNHTLGILSDSSLYTWGLNTYGQLGLSDASSNDIWSKLHDGGSHFVAIRSDGGLFAWGLNNNGQLGDGTVTNRNSPVKIGNESWSSVSAGLSHTIAVRQDGAMFAWGNNYQGQLGQGYANVGVKWSQVVIGSHVMAIRSDGTLWAWGLGGSGQLGQGASVNVSFPIQIGNDKWLKLATGFNGSLGIKNDGTLWAWGRNSEGQLGNNTLTAANSPTLVNNNNNSFVSVFSGYYTSAAITNEGYLYLWGYNAGGQLGINDTVFRTNPTKLNSNQWNTISIYTHALAIRNDGTLWGWGLNTTGQLGDGTTIARSSPIQVASGSWVAVATGGLPVSNGMSAAIRNDGSLWTWGFAGDGQLGDTTTVSRSSPVQVGISSWTQVLALKNGGFVAKKVDDTIWAWGLNSSGQLGQNDVINRSSPVQVPAQNGAVLADITPDSLTNGYLVDSVLYLFGSSLAFQLGKGDTLAKSSPIQLAAYANKSSPVQIGTNSWSQVAAGGNYSLGIDTANTLYGWGQNNAGQIGGATGVLTSPLQWNTIVGNTTATFAIRNDGSLWAWGLATNGMLGDVSVVTKSSPTLISTSSFSAIAAGDSHALAVTTDGRLFGWGLNNYGQAGALSWVQISTALDPHTMAIRSDGALFGWGKNDFGQLGDGTTVNRSSPVQLLSQGSASTASWISVVAGSTTTIAIRADYTLWAWGRNDSGELGQGDVISRSSPVQIGSAQFNYRYKFDGSTLYLTAPANAAWTFGSSDLTIECWMSNTNTTQWTTIVSRSNVIWGSGGWAFDVNTVSPGSGDVSFWAWDGDPLAGIVTSSGVNVCDGLVHHVVYVRSGNTHAIFVDGIRRAYRTLSFTISNAMSTAGLWIGNDQFYPTRYLNGIISDLRIVTGTAVYDPTLATLTVPTSPLTAITNTQLLIAQSPTIIDKSVNNLSIGGSVIIERASPFSSSLFAVSFIQVATNGWGSGFAITSLNTLWAWGANFNGTLGDGTTVSKSSPVQIPGSWSLVTGSNSYTSGGIKTDGTLWMWSFNSDGFLGDGTTITKSSPVQVPGSWTTLSLGSHAQAIRQDGTLWAWGYNGYGQLGQGLGDTSSRSSPVQVGTLSNWTKVTAGGNYGLAINSLGKLYGWGLNSDGRVGAPFISYSVVNGGSSYIRSDGRLYVWGRNDTGVLGLGDTISRSSPVQLGSDSWSIVDASQADSNSGFRMAIKADGTLWGWGYNFYGQLGDGTSGNYRSSPVQVAGGGTWTDVKTGYWHTLALKSDGNLYAWGRNTNNQLGDGTTIDKSSPVLVASTLSWSQISAGIQHNLALTSEGKMYGWGQNSSGEILPSPVTFTQLGNSMVVRSDGQLWLWGSVNPKGSLGDGNTVGRSSPVQVAGLWKSVQIRGDVATYPAGNGIKVDGTLWGWGDNTVGGIGDNTTISQSSPVQIGTATDWSKVFGLSDTNFAIKTDNTLYTWGYNATGALGDSTTISRSSPMQLSGSWSQIAANGGVVAGIKSDGTLWAWGSNIYGTLGQNDTVYRSSPTQIGTSSWIQVSVLYQQVAAIRSDGGLFTWGHQTNGSMGNGTTLDRSSPGQIGTSSWTQIAITYGGAAAITVDGKLFTWGAVAGAAAVVRSSPVQLGTSSWTQLSSGYFTIHGSTLDNRFFTWAAVNGPWQGDNTTVSKSSPVLTVATQTNLVGALYGPFSSPVIIGNDSWVQVSAGNSYSAALKATDRSLWTWGLNSVTGQLGNGTTLARSSPVQVGVLSWSMIAAGNGMTAGITTTGGLYTWGYGLNGGLGSGATASRSAPVQVATSSWSIVSLGGLNNVIGLDTTNRLFTWGLGTYGDVGDNTVVTKSSPVLLSALDTPIWSPVLINQSSWSVVSSGQYYTIAKTTDDRLWAWGLNTTGQLGDVSTVSRSSPVQVAAGTQSPNRSSPVQIASGSWTNVAAGTSFSAAIRNDGAIFTWGVNSSGQLGDSTTINRSYPTQIVSTTSWSQITAGADFVLAKNTTGQLYAWGNGWSGSLGNGNQGYRSSAVQIGNDSWSQVTTGSSHVIALKNNTLYGWGRNTEGQLTSMPDVGWSAVQSSYDGNSVMAIDMQGRLFAWGNPGIGANGIGYQDNGTIARSTPVQIAVGQSFIALSTNTPGSTGTAGVRFVIDSNNNLWGWGDNTYGTFGDNTTVSRSSPVQLNLGQSWKKIVQGTYGAALGLTTSGALYGWGRNSEGQLGLGDAVARSQPVQIPGSWLDVDTGVYVTHAIRSDGTLWGWGYNTSGEIGDNSVTQRTSPVQILAGKQFIAISHGYSCSFGITDTNDLYAWGQNSLYGQLGNNSVQTFSSPVQVGAGTKWSKIQGGLRNTIALTTTNIPYAWGQNDIGQLGLGDVINRSMPVQITSLPSIKTLMMVLDPSATISSFIDTNNNLWTTGNNSNGVLGDGTTVSRSSPVQVKTNVVMSPTQITTSSYTSISAGSTHTAAVTSNGKLFVWGGNSSYQLGDGTSINKSAPTQLGIGQSFVVAAALGNVTFGGTTFGTYNVGYNTTGQLGINTTVTTSALTQVSEPMSLVYPAPLRIGTSSWSQVSAGVSHTLALRLDSSLYAWGEAVLGQLGDNTTVAKSSPVQINAFSYVAVAAGRDSSSAIRANNTLWMWGNNQQGQLGDNTTVYRSSPVQIQGYWTDVEIGGSFTAALNVNGTIYAWGSNTFGGLGNDTLLLRSSPAQVGTKTYKSISVSETAVGGIDIFGSMNTFGDNFFGQLGNDTTRYSWTSLSSNTYHTFAVRSDNTLWAWGRNVSGELGDNSTTNRSSPVQIGYNNWLSVSSGYSHTAAIRTDYSVWAWGRNTEGQVGDGTTITRSSPTQITSAGISVVSVSAGERFTLAITNTNKLFAWGFNTNAQLGDGTLISRSSPVQIGTSSWTQVSAGGTHSLALDITNKLYAWGTGTSGQLGITSPTVTIGSDALSVAPNAYITNDGRLFVWGYNQYGQLGLGDTIGRSSPVQLGTSTDWYKIFKNVNIYQSLAVQKTDGSLWISGYNNNGQLGLGDTISRSSPVQLSAGAGLSWTQFAISQYQHAVGIKSDGTLWTMGSGTSGEIGDGNVVSRSSPVQVAGSWITCAAGTGFTFGIRTNYTLWAWGNNNLGYLGTGNTVYRSSPLQVNSSSSYNQVVASSQHSAAITTDYQLHTWGFNNAGQLGINTIVSSVNPVSTVAGGSWTQVAVGFYDTWAIKLDGTLWGWGDNSVGQVGDGTIINRSSPVQVSGGTGTTSWTLITTTGTTPAAKKLNDASLYIWGGGPIGDGTSVNRSSPVQVITPGSYLNAVMSPTLVSASSWSQVSASTTHSAAIDTSGRMFTWGGNSSGQLGYSYDFTAYPGATFTGFLRNDGSLFGSGQGAFGQFGDNNNINRSSPVQLGTGVYSLYSAATFNTNVSMAVRNDGKLFTWGRNLNGQLGDGTTIARSSPVQIGSSSWLMIAASDDAVASNYGMTLAIRSDNTLWAWGLNTFNQFGSSVYPSYVSLSSPVQVGTSSWTQVALGFDFALGLKADSTLWSWGTNTYGQLGVVAAESATSWSQISSGFSHVVALRSDGSVWTWGANTSGALGNNSTVARSNPVQVLSGSWTQVSAGVNSSIATKYDNTAWGWGDNVYGQLGDGTTVSRSAPVQLGATYSFYSERIGGTSSYINNDGNAPTALGFGTNPFTMEFWVNITNTAVSSGFISCEFSSTSRTSIYYDATTGNLVYYSNPINSILITTKVDLVSNTWYHIAYSRTGGTGRLFLNGVQVGSVADTYNLGTSNHVYVGYVPSGTINWLTGYLSNVRIVNGVGVYTGNFTVPTGNLTVTQSAGTNISAITAGQTVLLTCQARTLIDNSGTITLREVGTVTTDYLTVPFTQSVTSAKSFVQIAAGRSTTVSIQSDNTIWAWGGNSNFELADTTRIHRSSPVQIGAGLSTFAYSCLFNGINQYLSVAQIDNWAFGTRDFTVDGWFYLTQSKTHQILDNTAFGAFGFRVEPTVITIFQSSGSDVSYIYTTPLNEWVHIATVRYSGLTTTYVNGVPIGSTTLFNGVNFEAPGTMLIGKNTGSFDYVKGYINGFRMTKAALYAGTFKPDALLTNTGDTVLLTCQRSTVNDVSPYNRTVTNVGAATVENIAPSPYTNSWTQIDTNNGAIAAITSTGKLFGWGNNTTNQLSTKTTAMWKSVTVGAAVRADGRLYTWGSNFTGALGNNTVTNSSSPVQIGTATNWKMVTGSRGQYNNATTGGYTLGLKNDGSLWAWGSNGSGELGLGDTISRSSPVQIGTNSWTMVDVISSQGQNHTFAIRVDGTLWAWGSNTAGHLGDTTTVGRSSPVQIAADKLWLSVAALDQGGMAIRDDSTLWVWGTNSSGQIGDNTTVSKSSPVQIGTSTWMVVGGGHTSVYAITSDYRMFGWGYNFGGNVGDNTTVYRSSPVQIGTGSSWIIVSGSGFPNTGLGAPAFAIKTDNTLWAWGPQTPSGVLGVGDTIARSSPVQVSATNTDPTGTIGGTQIGKSFSYVRGAGFATYAIDNSGALWSWGDNGAMATYGNPGILGNGNTISRSAPGQIGTWFENAVNSVYPINAGMSFTEVSVGSDSSLSIKNDGTMLGWGANNSYQLAKPYEYSSFNGDTYTAAALRNDGVLMMWGTNTSGVLGDNTVVAKSSPVYLSAGSNKKWTYVALKSTGNAIAMKDDNTVWTWGDNTYGSIGDGTTIAKSSPVQVPAGTGRKWVQVDNTFRSSFGIKDDGTLWGWGGNSYGDLGLNDVNPRSSPVQVPGSWTNVWGGRDGAVVFAKQVDGTLWSWGFNTEGQLALNNIGNKSSPVQVPGGFPNMTSVVTSLGSCFYINSSGQLFGWGYNATYGSIGDGTTINRSSPVQLHAGASYIAIAAMAGLTTAGIRSDNTLWTWGTGSNGQLGSGATTNRSSPVQIMSGTYFDKVFNSRNAFYATQNAGATLGARVWAWGYNVGGQLGDNSTINKSAPVTILTSSTMITYALSSPVVVTSGSWTQVIANKSITTTSDSSAFGIKTDGTVWGWGSNTYGLLGLGTVLASVNASPRQLDSATNWTSIARGENVAFRLNASGQLYGTGNNAGGELGQNNTIARSNPVQVVPLTQIEPTQLPGSYSQIGISNYGQHAFAIKTDGSLYAWGRNDYGQLGQNDTVSRSSPIQINAGTSFVSVAAGNIPLLGAGIGGAVTNTGLMYTWGYGVNGQLGANDVVTRSRPVQIGFDNQWSNIYGGGYTLFAKDSQKKLYGWGLGDFGMTAQNDTVARSSPVQVNTLQGIQPVSSPVQIGTSTNWSQVVAGDAGTAAITTTGTLFVWGNNAGGGIGDGTTLSRSSPVQVTGLSYSMVSVGSSYTVSIVENDPYFGKRLVSTGLNTYGSLGINSVANQSMPVAVSIAVAMNTSSPVQAGSSSVNYRSSPVQVGSNSWTTVSAGENHSLGIDSSSSLFGWGYNVNGQVGDSTTINKSSPVQISTSTGWVDVEAGYNYSAVEKSDGSIYTFGNNSDGQLGDGT